MIFPISYVPHTMSTIFQYVVYTAGIEDPVTLNMSDSPTSTYCLKKKFSVQKVAPVSNDTRISFLFRIQYKIQNEQFYTRIQDL